VNKQSAVSRRDFLWKSGVVLVSFSLKAALPKLALGQAPVSPEGRSLDPREVDSFLAFHTDGSVTIYTSKVDVGTGLRMAMSQMAAEELGIPVERVSIVEGDTGLTPNHGGTGGSSGVPRGAVEVRQAAATAREAILRLAADQLKRPAAELIIVNSQVQPASGGPGVSVATLIGDKRLSLQVDPNAPLKDPATYALVGKPVLRPDVPGKCTGQHTYVQDFRLPGMLHARVIRPAAIGAKLISVDEGSIRGIPDIRIIQMESFLAVVASDEWAAVRAAGELKARWSERQGLPGSDGLDRFVRESTPDRDEVLVSRGDPAVALPKAAKQLSATYWWPCQSHASLGPSCAVADVRSDGASVWTATQGTYGLRANLAKVFGLVEDKIRVIYLDGSGSYGGNGNDDAAADAFVLSQKLGRPVRVQWMRHDEHGWDPKGPPQLLDLRGGIDSEGRIVAWETQMWLPMNVPGNRPLLAADAAAIPQSHGQGAGLMSQNGDPPYAVANLRVVSHWVKETPLRPSNLRAPGKVANVFAVESFADELAAAAGIDSVEFRLRGLGDPRAIDVLKRAAEMMDWQTRPSPNPHRVEGNSLVGRGVAYARYKQAENYVAIAVDVAVNPTNGEIRVRHVSCAHDGGLTVNPDGLRNQIEGSIVQTLSRTLCEEVKFDHSHVTSVDWASYPILSFPAAPSVQVALLDHPELPPFGAGEAASAPVAAALGNAIFDATGARLRSAPFTRKRMQAALNA
jgi:nicotinate dehydrogenase subunit B